MSPRVIDPMRKKDLKERTCQYAQEVRSFLKAVPRTPGNVEDARQLLRSSGSIGANYLEADNALSQRDALMRIRICLTSVRFDVVDSKGLKGPLTVRV